MIIFISIIHPVEPSIQKVSLLLKCITAFLGSLQNSSRHGASNWITTGHFEGES